MKTMKTILAVSMAMVGGALFFGCSSSDSGSDACGHYYDVSASRAEKCGLRTQGDKARWGQVCSSLMGLNGSGINAEWLNTCANALESADCGTTDISECEEPVGTLKTNDTCYADIQCESGACDGTEYEKDGSLSCGTCEKKGSGSSSSSVKKVGEACVEISGTTTRTYQCVKGAYCLVDGTSATCKAQLKNGKACSTSNECESGRCHDSKCTARAKAGDACESSSECDVALGCEDGECTKYTYGDPGDECDVDAKLCKEGFCAFDLTASSGKGKCPTILEDGKSCDSKDTTEQCKTYSRCINGECTFPYASLECKENGASTNSTDDTGASGK